MAHRVTVTQTVYIVPVLCCMVAAFFPRVSLAVLPPELIVSVGSQVAGIFSLLVAVTVSFFASMAMLYVGWYQWFRQYSVHIAFGLLAVALLVSNGFYIWYIQNQNHQTITEPSVVPALDPITASSTSVCHTCQFYSESITLYVPDTERPLVLEIDMNRRQDETNQYTHYYFADGLVDGQVIDTYTQFTSDSYVLRPYGYLRDIQRNQPADASVRDTYAGEVQLAPDSVLRFETQMLAGDFITRNTPEYTQFQSVAKALVTIDSEEKTAFVLVENLHSTNYQKRIFFPGLDTLESITHQFVLWDEEDNFYLIDDSQVFSDTPAYPTHSWLLYKGAATGATEKGFYTQITQTEPDSWEVTVPDFNNGIIRVSSVNAFQVNPDNRSRYIVSGTVTDSEGQRAISGILKLVQ